MNALMQGDLLIVGAGTAGIPAAIFAARRGARVVLAEATDSPDGTLRRAAGHVSAGGTRLQMARGIVDDPAAHAADIMRITKGTADAAMVTRACELAPGVAVSGDRLRNPAKSLIARIWAFWALSPIPCIRISSIIRSRSGVIFSCVMGTSCLTIEKPQSSNRFARSQNALGQSQPRTPATSAIAAAAASSLSATRSLALGECCATHERLVW